MKHWTVHKSKIEDRLGKRPLALFLDFDGTLVPLRAYEEEANLSSRMKHLLNALAASPRIQVSIVSGRPLQALRRQIKNPQIFLAGNHGFEIHGPKTKFLHPTACKAKKIFKLLSDELRCQLKDYPGAALEDKTYTLSVHYRGISAVRAKKLSVWLPAWLREHSLGRSLGLQEGKKVWEIRPLSSWNKGAALNRILSVGRMKSPLSVYIGDDLTDEDAFRALPPSGWGFKVTASGKGVTAADAFVKNPAEVEKCLLWFKSLMK
jgi:trehalose 6-phosphate phosphatase